MRKIAVSAMAAGVLAACVASASAADMPTPIAEPVPAGGVYIGAFGGATWFNKNETDFDVFDGGAFNGKASLDTDMGYIVGGVLGYNWTGDFGGLRSELEVSYSEANVDGVDLHFDGPAETTRDINFDSDLSVVYVMGNLWYDIGRVLDWGGFSPYAGGGLGAGFVNFNVDGGGDWDLSSSETGLAYQLGGGVRWSWDNAGTAIDLGYRWKGVTLEDFDDLQSSSVILGVTWGF
jgi:opacity protein-like surface antigen